MGKREGGLADVIWGLSDYICSLGMMLGLFSSAILCDGYLPTYLSTPRNLGYMY